MSSIFWSILYSILQFAWIDIQFDSAYQNAIFFATSLSENIMALNRNM